MAVISGRKFDLHTGSVHVPIESWADIPDYDPTRACLIDSVSHIDAERSGLPQIRGINCNGL